MSEWLRCYMIKQIYMIKKLHTLTAYAHLHWLAYVKYLNYCWSDFPKTHWNSPETLFYMGLIFSVVHEAIFCLFLRVYNWLVHSALINSFGISSFMILVSVLKIHQNLWNLVIVVSDLDEKSTTTGHFPLPNRWIMAHIF